MIARSDVELRRRQQELQQLAQRKVLIRLFGHLWHFARTPLKHFKQVGDPDKFIRVKVAGMSRSMKLDPTGWALEDGRTLDRLAKP